MPRAVTSVFTQILRSDIWNVPVQCCFTSTEDGVPRAVTSVFTQILRSDIWNVPVQCCFTSTEDGGAKGGHLSFHTDPQFKLYVHRGRGAKGGHLDFRPAPEL